MFGSSILDLAIGLVFIFLLLSIIASALREALEGLLHSRAAQLERGMRELLHDSKGTGLTKDVYSHPLICSLFQGSYDPSKVRGFSGLLARRQLPSYIPKENFALALVDMVVHGTDASRSIVGPALAEGTSIGTVRAQLGSLGNVRVERAILTALDSANGSAEQLRRNLEDWFDGSMDRVSGWYKRQTQFILLAIGLVLAVGGNVDTLGLAQYLNDNKPARDVLVAQATTAAKNDSILKANAEVVAARLDALKLPIGWSSFPVTGCDSQKVKVADTLRTSAPSDSASRVATTSAVRAPQVVMREAMRCVPKKGTRLMSWDLFFERMRQSWLGWLMTALAVSFGAPFWFDMLNKLIVVRSTVKPKEKSLDEGTKDKATGGSGGAGGAGGTPPAAPVPPGVAPPPVTATPAIASERLWATGDPREGIL